MSASGISRTNSNNVSANSNVATKFEPRGNNNLSFSKAVSGGEFACYRDSASSKIWHWGWQGKDASGKPVSLTGEVTLSGKFTEKELTNGSTLKNKFEEARKAGAKPVIKLALSKTPKLSLPNPSYSVPSSPLGGFRTGNTSNPYASSYAPVAKLAHTSATQYQTKADTLLKRASVALGEFDASPSSLDLRNTLNNVAAEMNSLVCSINAQKVKPETIQALSSQLVKAQGRLNPKLSALDNAAAGYYDGASRPVEWIGEQIAGAKIPVISKVAKARVDIIAKDRRNLVAIGLDTNRTSGKMGVKFGDSLAQTAIITGVFATGGAVLTPAAGAVKVVDVANKASKVSKIVKPLAKLVKPLTKVIKPLIKASKPVVKAIAAKPKVQHIISGAKNTGKFLINPNVHAAGFTAWNGVNITKHVIEGDVVALAGDLGSAPMSGKDFFTTIVVGKNIAKSIKNGKAAANVAIPDKNNIVPLARKASVKNSAKNIVPGPRSKPESAIEVDVVGGKVQSSTGGKPAIRMNNGKPTSHKKPRVSKSTLQQLRSAGKIDIKTGKLAVLLTPNQEIINGFLKLDKSDISEASRWVSKHTSADWAKLDPRLRNAAKKGLSLHPKNEQAKNMLNHISKLEEGVILGLQPSLNGTANAVVLPVGKPVITLFKSKTTKVLVEIKYNCGELVRAIELEGKAYSEVFRKALDSKKAGFSDVSVDISTLSELTTRLKKLIDQAGKIPNKGKDLDISAFKATLKKYMNKITTEKSNGVKKGINIIDTFESNRILQEEAAKTSALNNKLKNFRPLKIDTLKQVYGKLSNAEMKLVQELNYTRKVQYNLSGGKGALHLLDYKKIIGITRTQEGKIVFIEVGKNYFSLNRTTKEKAISGRGIIHVLDHVVDFENIGVLKQDISSLLLKALQKNKVIAAHGTGRPVYEVEYGGRKIGVGITVTDYGSVIGAHPEGDAARIIERAVKSKGNNKDLKIGK